MRFFLFTLLSLCLFTSHAELYKWIDENGETIYSDEPPHDNATPLVPPPITTTPAIKYKPSIKKNAPVEEKEKKKPVTIYTRFKITSPANNETIRDNSGSVTVNLTVTPDLDVKEGHTISMLVNSQTKIEGSTGLTITLKNLDRGSHSIQAVIKNRKKKIVKSSNSVTIHMRRFSKLHKKPTP